MIFDTHAHYDDKAFDEDREELLEGMKQAGITKIVNIGASIETSKATIQLTREYDFIYGAIGVHPQDVVDLTEDDIQFLKESASLDKIVAIGEIGLDYYWDEPEASIQKKWFERQLTLAKEVDLPVIIHSRDAAKDTMDILKSNQNDKLGGIIHCYSYSKETARDYLNMNYYFGIGGVITFNNAKKLKEAAAYIPLENIILETDCPYLAPTPFRGKRNSSLFLTYVAEEIASIKEVPVEKVYEETYKNAMKIYRIAE